MRSPVSHMLEMALALKRAPGERFRLLAQPLPPGLTHVLEVAAGAPVALQEAAAELGESEAVVLEAARFYLEQMLFAAPDADAYRILGVAPQAPSEEIRLHHRLLQRWLHPDRALAGDASVFATRVNQAWSQLRTPALRHDYDVMLTESRLAGADAPLPAATFRRWAQEEVVSSHGRRSRWLFAAALASCGVLVVLIAVHEDEGEQPAWDPPSVEAAPAVAENEGNEVAPLSRALAAPVGQGRRKSPAIDLESGAAVRNSAIARLSPAPLVAPPSVSRAAPAGVDVPRPSGSLQARSPSPRRATIAPLAVLASARPAAPPQPSPTSPAGSGVTGERISSTASRRDPVPSVAVESPSQGAAGVAVATVGIVHGAGGEVASAPAPQAPPPGEGNPAVLLDRMHKAEQRVAQVAAYLSATPGASPMWNDVRTQVDADRVRQQLALRQGEALQLAMPNWQLRPDNASFSGTYHCARCGIREGRLEVKLVWREGLWLVRGIDLGPSA